MIISGTSTYIDGLDLLGETFVAADDDSAHAVFVRGERCCGVTFEMGDTHPYLRCNPGLMLPKEARDRSAWMREAWREEDERLFDVRIDEDDGGLTYIDSDDELGADVERYLAGALDFMLSDDFHDFVTRFVDDCLGDFI